MGKIQNVTIVVKPREEKAKAKAEQKLEEIADTMSFNDDFQSMFGKGEELLTLNQTENRISIVIADHQARDLLTCVDSAIILHNTTIVASGTPNQLMDNKQARSAYFGDSFKFS